MSSCRSYGEGEGENGRPRNTNRGRLFIYIDFLIYAYMVDGKSSYFTHKGGNGMSRNQRNAAWWEQTFTDKGALRLSGEPGHTLQHYVTRKGLHTAGYCNSENVTNEPLLVDKAAYDLVKNLVDNGLNLEKVDRVIGPAMGAVVLAHAVALQISRRRKYTCLSGYAKRNQSGFTINGTHVQAHERVLLVDDVFTTGSSLQQVLDATERADAIAIPIIATMVNRSSLSRWNSRRISSLFGWDVPVWHPKECPLCAAGVSLVVDPKDLKDWQLLELPT